MGTIYIALWAVRGPALLALSNFYRFTVDTDDKSPIHNPCGGGEGGGKINYKKGVANAGGQIYLRYGQTSTFSSSFDI